MICDFHLGDNLARVWFSSIESVLAIPDSACWLDDEDVQREARRRLEKDRRAFRAGRIMVRRSLSQLDQGKRLPSDWSFQYHNNERPILDPLYADWKFSISHAENCVAVAVGQGFELGIDIEHLSSALRIGVVADVLTPDEATWLSTFPIDERPERFVGLWTLKEACAKSFAVAISDWRDIDVSDLNNIRINNRNYPAQVWQHKIHSDGEDFLISVVAIISPRAASCAESAPDARLLKLAA